MTRTNAELARLAWGVVEALKYAQTDEECVAALEAVHALTPATEDKLEADYHVLEALDAQIAAQTAEAGYWKQEYEARMGAVARLQASREQLRDRTRRLLEAHQEMTGDSKPFRLPNGCSLSVGRTVRLDWRVDKEREHEIPPECFPPLSPQTSLVAAYRKAYGEVPGIVCTDVETLSLRVNRPRKKDEPPIDATQAGDA
jgi:hypothetical protein